MRKETVDTVTVCFDVQGDPFAHAPGQFINITLDIDGKEITRAYSLSSSPGDQYPAITVKKVDQGAASTYIFKNAHEITEWKIEGPFGNFILEKEAVKERQLIFLGGGSGITPLFSMIQSMDGGAIPSPALIYANRDWNNVIFKEHLSELERRKKISVFHALSAPQLETEDLPDEYFKGRLNRLGVKKLIKQITPEPGNAYYFICGPEQLMQLYRESLDSLGVPSVQIYSENFYPAAGQPDVSMPKEPIEVVVNFCDSEKDYESTTLVTVQPGQDLLSAVFASGIPVKHSCKSGSCGTCWARHVSGQITMVNNYALTREEVENQAILLCQSYALDNQVTIDIG